MPGRLVVRLGPSVKRQFVEIVIGVTGSRGAALAAETLRQLREAGAKRIWS